ncbi:MAG: DNA-binding response regulator [Bacteroidetes bacterium]|nr:MAG: DNA-binding response regulator [Bacteroidota bacterium]
MISIVVIDDEPKAREAILSILSLSPIELNIIGEAGDVESAYKLISTKSPDLILLDINLPDGSGFDLLKRFGKINFKVIFITAHQEHAIRAFKYSAVDYILKPITAGGLFSAIEKAAEEISKQETVLKLGTLLSNLEKLKKIVLKTAESIHIINVSQIIRCEADVNYTTFYLQGGEKLLVSKPLKEYDDLLSQAGFFRTHQSHLVSLDHMLRYEKTDGGYLVMDDHSAVPVSVRKKEELFRLFENM